MAQQYNSQQQGQLLWTRQVEIASTAEQTASEFDINTEITRQHWKIQDGITNCRNKQCMKKFSLIERIHHCRRCGEIFCKECVNYQRRLNKLAHPDPEGKAFKVCKKCFDEGKNLDGQKRRLTEYFFALRRQTQENAIVLENGKVRGTWRNRLDLEKEVRRLLNGFKDSIGTSEMKRTIHEMTNIVSTPAWQKSTFWLQENMANQCQKCQQKFNLVRSKHNCKLCGRAVCKSCSFKDVILYLPDEEDTKEPRLAVIKVIGSPSVEPELALYTAGKVKKEEKMLAKGGDSLEMLLKVHSTMHRNEVKMEDQLNEYQIIIESLEDNSRKLNSSGKSNIQTVAKAQEDLADYLAQYVLNIQRMKKLTPESNTQAILFRNCLKGKCDFYFDNQFRFKSLQKTLGDSTPPKILECIQRTVDKHAIVSTQLYIRQLTYETLHICDKYKLRDDIPQKLTQTDEFVEKETIDCIGQDGDDIDDHTEQLQELLQSQLKDHRLIKLSKRTLKCSGSHHAADMLITRSTDILHQVKVQLMMKSANRSFPQTKQTLDQTLEELKTVTLQDIVKL
ncbi:RBSN [Mytilus coruscus]|uniref:RBSN n=1 Tax=Mytilus coruscus TaxID=42192 RepID=A0A6J8C735_MYTCO|nr:unnamed protein product [Mytilus coruscus]CAC5391287.1 RBSN [Mytilus coruscus]